MKAFLKDRRGATLIELIASVAILSIVALSCFILLMFSIRTNSFIVTGSSFSQDSDLLNERLALLLKDAEVTVDGDAVLVAVGEDTVGLLFLQGEELVYQPADGERQILEDNISGFEAEIVEEDGVLLRIEYTFDETYSCVKIFSCQKCMVASAEES